MLGNIHPRVFVFSLALVGCDPGGNDLQLGPPGPLGPDAEADPCEALGSGAPLPPLDGGAATPPPFAALAFPVRADSIAIDDDQLYLALNNQVVRAPALTQPPACGRGYAFEPIFDAGSARIAHDATTLYVLHADTDGYAIEAIDKTSGNERNVARGLIGGGPIAVDGTMLYVGQDLGGALGGTVSRIPTVGGPPTLLLSGLAAPWDLAISADYVFVADGTQVVAVDKSGGAPLQLASSTDQPCALTLLGDWVYVVERGPRSSVSSHCFPAATGGALSRIPQPPPQATPSTLPVASLERIVADLAGPVRMVADSTRIYWASAFAGVQRASHAGGEVELLVDTGPEGLASAIAQSGTHIYFSAGTVGGGAGGATYMTPK